MTEHRVTNLLLFILSSITLASGLHALYTRQEQHKAHLAVLKELRAIRAELHDPFKL